MKRDPTPQFRIAQEAGDLVEVYYPRHVVIYCSHCWETWRRGRSEGRRTTIADRNDAAKHLADAAEKDFRHRCICLPLPEPPCLFCEARADVLAGNQPDRPIPGEPKRIDLMDVLKKSLKGEA